MFAAQLSACAANSRVSEGWNSVHIKGTVVAFKSDATRVGNSFTGIPENYDAIQLAVDGPFSDKCESFSIFYQKKPEVEGKVIHLKDKLSFDTLVALDPDDAPELFCNAFIDSLKHFKRAPEV